MNRSIPSLSYGCYDFLAERNNKTPLRMTVGYDAVNCTLDNNILIGTLTMCFAGPPVVCGSLKLQKKLDFAQIKNDDTTIERNVKNKKLCI